MKWQTALVCVVVLVIAAFSVPGVQAASVDELRARVDQNEEAVIEDIRNAGLDTQKALVPDLIDAYIGDGWGMAMKARSLLIDVGKEVPSSVVPHVVEELENTPEDELAVRLPLVELLRDLGPAAKGAVDTLTEALASDDLSIQEQAVLALRAIGPDARSAVQELTELLDSKDAALRSEVVMALRSIGVGPSAVPALEAALDSEDPSVRRYAVQALGEIGPAAKPAVPTLVDIVKTSDRFLQLKAVETLGSIGPGAEEAIPVLVEVAEGKSKVALETISEALNSIKTENTAPQVRALRGTCEEGKSADVKMPVTDQDDVWVALKGSIVEAPDNGSLERTGPLSFVYSTEPGFVGRDTWTWKATDGKAESAETRAVMEITPDKKSPEVENVIAVEKNDRVTLEFSEPVAADSARDTDNYTIEPDVTVKSASLGENGTTVILKTSPLSQNVEYALSVKNVRDRAKAANEVAATMKNFQFRVWKREKLVLLARGDGNAKDESENGYNGKLSNGVSYGEGVRAEAFKFAGAGGDKNNTVNFGDVKQMNGPKEFTVAMWFKRAKDKSGDTNHNVSNVLFSKGSDNDNDNIEIGTDGSNIEVYLDTTGNDDNASADAGIKDGQWYHLALTYQAGRKQEAQLHIDGKHVKSWDMWGGNLDNAGGSPLTIGNTHHQETPFQGLIDEFFVFNRVIGDGEIQALAAAK